MISFLKKIGILVYGINYLKNRRQKKECAKLQSLGAEALTAYNNVANSLGFSFVPMFGTLLGAYRQNSFIPYDDDIDMVLDIKHLNKELFQALQHVGFRLEYLYITSSYRGCQLPMKYKGLTCDIYFSYQNKDGGAIIDLPLALENHDWTYSARLNLFRAKRVIIPSFQEVCDCKLSGEIIKIPSNSKEILEFLYGSDFMTPKKGANADPPVYQVPIYENFYKCYPLDFVLENNLIDVIREKAI